jgi:hypothetical protein
LALSFRNDPKLGPSFGMLSGIVKITTAVLALFTLVTLGCSKPSAEEAPRNLVNQQLIRVGPARVPTPESWNGPMSWWKDRNCAASFSQKMLQPPAHN